VAANSQQAVLCTYGHDQPQLLEYMMAVTSAVATSDLPFAVPNPIPAVNGERLYRHDDGYRTWLMSLMPWLPGDHPASDDMAACRQAGQALGWLLQALEKLSVTPPSPPASLNLHRVHAYVIDPLAALRAAPLNHEQVQQIIAVAESLQLQLPPLYEQLPQQIIHGDYVPRNVLVLNDTVSAVLDFEWCRYDARALDVAIALLAWGGFASSHDGVAMQQFVQGLHDVVPLNDTEIAALPTLMRLVYVVRLLQVLGRFQQGIERAVVVERAALSLIELDTWLNETSDFAVLYQSWLA
jgi:Ser/Thr protein kinase RdoA (MazF antagonist)